MYDPARAFWIAFFWLIVGYGLYTFLTAHASFLDRLIRLGIVVGFFGLVTAWATVDYFRCWRREIHDHRVTGDVASRGE